MDGPLLNAKPLGGFFCCIWCNSFDDLFTDFFGFVDTLPCVSACAVVDTGVYPDHEDFMKGGGSTASRVLNGYGGPDVGAYYGQDGSDCYGSVTPPGPLCL
eukprot:scaffold196724_cov29-Prasinocladus_malaysianus.AAC.1